MHDEPKINVSLNVLRNCIRRRICQAFRIQTERLHVENGQNEVMPESVDPIGARLKARVLVLLCSSEALPEQGTQLAPPP